MLTLFDIASRSHKEVRMRFRTRKNYPDRSGDTHAFELLEIFCFL